MLPLTRADILNAVRLLRQKLDKAMELKLDKAVSQIESCDKLLKLYSPEKRLEQSEKAVCDLEKRLSQIMKRRFEKLSVKLDGYVSSLNMLSPFNILGRGYAIVQKDERRCRQCINAERWRRGRHKAVRRQCIC